LRSTRSKIFGFKKKRAGKHPARYSFGMHGPRLTPEILLRAYAEGLFPMA
jgi:Leu/Phe-tRNA-protein transferase